MRWEIDLSAYRSTDLETDPVLQAVFVHEYVHYVQALTGTIGRHILLEMVRLAIFAGISRRHGWPPPAGYDQVHLHEVLENAAPADFQSSEPRRQYHEFIRDLLFALDDTAGPAPAGTTPGVLLRRTLTVGANTVDDFVHVTGTNSSGVVAVPVTDRVVFENMARQVQRNYLRFNNNLDTSAVDDERNRSHGDLTYVCLHDVLANRLPASEDSGKWTITLCQVALLCRNPGTAFERIINSLTGLRNTDLTSFVQALNRDAWFQGEFNEPPVQELLNELIGKWGTAILPRENWEMREFTKLVANACNALLGDYSLMASPLLTWKDVGHWIARFGCPPLTFSDGTISQVQGIATSSPWTWYLRRLDDLMR